MFLLLQLKEGNIDAYEQLFKKYYKQLLMEAYFLLKDEMEAEDQVQSLFIEIWDRQLYLNINTSVKSYLHVSIRNRCLGVIKKEKTAQKRIDKYAYTLDEADEVNVVERRESDGRLATILSELPGKRSQAFSLVYLEDKKYKEAADEMGITINSVKTHLKLAVKALQQRLVHLK